MLKRFVVVSIIATCCVVGFLWQRYHRRAEAAKVESEILKRLSVDDIKLTLQSQASVDGSSVERIVATSETRRTFLAGLRQYLALAAQARRDGLNSDSKFKVNYELKTDSLLADIYKAKLSTEKTGVYAVPADQVRAYLADPNHVKEFDTTTEIMRSIAADGAQQRGTVSLASKPVGDNLIKARDGWARMKILAAMAKADTAFMGRPEISLRLKVMEAGLLSNLYLQKNWARNITPTSAEIAAYLAAHPELDLKKKRAKAQDILLRVKSGEDFSKLAQEFSEDRASKDRGGLIENVTKGFLWKQVEEAALHLNPGEIADGLIESEIGYHIVKLEDRRPGKDDDGNETTKFTIRHIVLQKKFEEINSRPGVPPPFMTAEEIAHAQVEEAKRVSFIESVIARNPIQLPDDFEFKLGESGPEAATNEQTKSQTKSH